MSLFPDTIYGTNGIVITENAGPGSVIIVNVLFYKEGAGSFEDDVFLNNFSVPEGISIISSSLTEAGAFAVQFSFVNANDSNDAAVLNFISIDLFWHATYFLDGVLCDNTGILVIGVHLPTNTEPGPSTVTIALKTQALQSIEFSLPVLNGGADGILTADYTIPDGLTITGSYISAGTTYHADCTFVNDADKTFEFFTIALAPVIAEFSFNGLRNTPFLLLSPTSPATWDISVGQVSSISGSHTEVNINGLPWLGGASFADDYTLPAGLSLIDSSTYSGLYWSTDWYYVALKPPDVFGMFFNFVPIPDLELQYYYINANDVNGSFKIEVNDIVLLDTQLASTTGNFTIKPYSSVQVQVNNNSDTLTSSYTIDYNSVLNSTDTEIGNVITIFNPPVNSSPVHITAISEGE